MRLTYRLVLLLALGALPLMFVARAPWLLTAVLTYNALLAACAIADFLASPPPDRAVSLTRAVDDKLALGAPNAVTIEVRNRTNAPLALTLRDLPPPTFGLDRAVEGRMLLPPDPRPVRFVYHVTPPAKGDFTFGDLYFQYPGRLGLIRRQAVAVARRSVKVYPNLVETAKYELLARRGRLMQLGIRAARIRGGGSEFESLREYVPGDEYKKIDWSATARRGKLISRQYEAERSQNIMLLLDTGRNMLQSIQKMAKLDYVVNTALMLAYVAAASDDKVGLMAFDADIRAYLPPAKSKAQVYGILESLYNLEARMVETDYKAAFQNLSTRWRRRSLVVLFTDLVDPDSSVQMLDAVPMISDQHRVVCVTVSDPNILAAAKSVPTDSAGVYRKAVATQVLQERRAAISVLKRRGVWTIDSPPEELSADLINHYMDLKARSMI